MARQTFVRLTLKIPKAWASMADQLALYTGQRRASYLKDALIRQMMADWQTAPGRGYWIRPGAPVYWRDGDGFKQVAAALGGERVWPIEAVGSLPASLGGAPAFRCDIVAVGMKQGLSMSDGIVGRDSFGGPV